MDNIRIPLSHCQKVESDENSGTLTRGKFVIPGQRDTGFFKINYDEHTKHLDLRELLASRLLQAIEHPVAQILLAFDDTKNINGCFSLNILKEGEIFLDPDPLYMDSIASKLDNPNSLDGFIEADLNFYRDKHKVPPEFLEERKEFLIRYAFISAFLGNADIKTSNCQVIFNELNGKYRNPEYYDMGMSFNPTYEGSSETALFCNRETDLLLLEEIYQNYSSKVQDLSVRIGEILTREKVRQILDSKDFDDFGKEFKSQIFNQLGEKIAYITKQNEVLYGEPIPMDAFITSREEIGDVAEQVDIGHVDRVRAFLQVLLKKVKDGIDNLRGF